VAYKNTIAITLNSVKQISYVVIVFYCLMLKPAVQFFLEEFVVLSLGFGFCWLFVGSCNSPFLGIF
jgi:hypothetical protein